MSPVRGPQTSDTSPGVIVSPSRHQLLESTLRQASQTCLCSARSVLHALDGFLLPEPCRLVSSCYHVRDSLIRGFSQRPARLAHHQPMPSCRWRLFPAKELPPPRQFLSPRLQGFDPATDSLQSTRWLALPMPVPLSSFHSRGFLSEHLESTFALSPLMALAADSSCDADSSPSAYQSMLSLFTCLQASSPFKFCGLPLAAPRCLD